MSGGHEPPRERKVFTMFHYYTLPEVYDYAVKMGYTHDDVEITFHEEDGYYDVSFGREYTEMWYWEFDDLDAPSTVYEHMLWED